MMTLFFWSFSNKLLDSQATARVANGAQAAGSENWKVDSLFEKKFHWKKCDAHRHKVAVFDVILGLSEFSRVVEREKIDFTSVASMAEIYKIPILFTTKNFESQFSHQILVQSRSTKQKTIKPHEKYKVLLFGQFPIISWLYYTEMFVLLQRYWMSISLHEFNDAILCTTVFHLKRHRYPKPWDVFSEALRRKTVYRYCVSYSTLFVLLKLRNLFHHQKMNFTLQRQRERSEPGIHYARNVIKEKVDSRNKSANPKSFLVSPSKNSFRSSRERKKEKKNKESQDWVSFNSNSICRRRLRQDSWEIEKQEKNVEWKAH